MSRDILVDATEAQHFCNPVEPEYITFIKWLVTTGELIMTQSLLIEHHRAVSASPSNTSIPAIVDHLMKQGRYRKFHKHELDAFLFPAGVRRRLRSNFKDHDSIKAVLMSVRKVAISNDDNLRYDINNYPGYAAHAAARPSDIAYV